MSVIRLLTKLGRSEPTAVIVHDANGDAAPTHVVVPGDEHTVEVPVGGWVVIKVATDEDATLPPPAAKAKAKKPDAKPAKAKAKK